MRQSVSHSVQSCIHGKWKKKLQYKESSLSVSAVSVTSAYPRCVSGVK